MRPFLLSLHVMIACVLSEPCARAEDTEESPVGKQQPAATNSSRFFFSAEGGYSVRDLYSVPYWGPAAGIEVGMESGSDGTHFPRGSVFRIGFAVRWVGGATGFGVPMYDVAMGPRAQLGLGRLSVGVGVRLAYIQVARRTDGSALSTFTLGLDGLVSLDVVTLHDGHALVVALEPTLDPIFTLAPAPSSLGFLAGASAAVGFRW